jgi:DNA-binding FadR family transcriptional regulator
VVIGEIEDAMLRGELSSGDRLPSERELSSRFGVSRSTIREAVQSLENDGLLAARPHDPGGGWFVQLPSGRPLHRSLVSYARFDNVPARELVQFRMVMESATSYLAALSWSGEQMELIRTTQDALAQLVGADVAAFSAADAAFHAAITAASGNRLLVVCSSASRFAVEELIGGALQESPDKDQIMKDFLRRHELLIGAIAARDAALAAERAARDILECYEHIAPGVGSDHPVSPFIDDILTRTQDGSC